MKRTIAVGFAVLALAACGNATPDKDSNNGSSGSNNGSAGSNNGGPANNGVGTSNNGVGTSNNGTTLAPANNGVTAGTNNGTTGGTNNGTVPASCEERQLTACFQNSDCAADERCDNVNPGGIEIACCVVGPRGTGQVGDMCTAESDCESGICIARNDDPEICSQECEGPDGCPGNLECNSFLGLCVTPDM